MDTSQAHGSETTTSPPLATASGAAAAPRQGSPLRLGILLLVLAACIGALIFDYQVAKPGSEAANEKIKQFVDTRNQMAAKEAGPVISVDIQKEIGRSPTWVEEEPTYTVEWYCWWGKTPLLSTRRHYITVLYVGEKRRFSNQYLNGPPPDEDLPTYFVAQPIPSDVGPLEPPSGSVGGGEPGPPPGVAPGMGGKGKGKGKKGKAGTVAPSTSSEPPLPGTEPETTTEPPAEKPPTAPASEKPAEGDKPAEPADKPAVEKPADESSGTDKPVPSGSSDAP